MHCIAVIHARGGSKRVPLKNIKPLAGKPLIQWTVQAALNCKDLDRVMVSTDHDGIAEAAEQAGAEVPFRRPPEISEDVPSELVTQHAIKFHEDQTGRTVDVAVTIQPTTPFITGEDISQCLKAVEADPNLTAAVSVYPIHERPEWMFRADNETGAIAAYLNTDFTGDVGVSQTLEPLYHPNGGIYASRRATVFEQTSLYGDNCYGHVMDRLRSVDIDEPVDFLVAEAVAKFLADSGTS